MRARYFYLTAFIAVFLDQVCKYLVLRLLGMGGKVPVFGSFVELEVVGNRGGAFGLFKSFTGLLIFASAVFVITILFFVKNKRELPVLLPMGLSLMLGGSLGNLIDRIRYGYVIDFMSVWIWPVFNLADAAIVIGVVLVAWFVIFQDGKTEEKDSSLRSESGRGGDGGV